MPASPRLSMIFSCVGHAFIHMFTAFYFVIVLALQVDWQRPYADLIGLWTAGALLVGLAALPAGWLGDRWSKSGMMAVFFIGMGAAAVAAGLCDTPPSLTLALAGIGLFAAIYHPVGIPWLVRNAAGNRGMVLGINGVFGSLGAALAGAVAGGLIDLGGWRAAFIVPGAVSIVIGLLLWICIATGRVTDGAAASVAQAPVARGAALRAFAVLIGIMFIGGLIYQSTQISLPKLFEQRHGGLSDGGVFGIGLLVAAVYTVAGVMQLLGGWLADRLPVKWVYVVALALQVPFLWLAASLTGLPLLLAASAMVAAGIGALPAENVLLSRYTPSHRHGLAFGAKFVVTFCAAPLAVQLVALVVAATGGLYWIFAGLAMAGAVVAAAAVLLPVPPASTALTGTLAVE